MPNYPDIKGDKKNSGFFHKYLPLIYKRREELGLTELLTTIKATLVQVTHGEVIPYLLELYLMTPYRLKKAFVSDTHHIYILENTPESPQYIVLEPLSKNYHDHMIALNSQFKRGQQKPQARYLGEIFHTNNLRKTTQALQAQETRILLDSENHFLQSPKITFTEPSYFTNNLIGYTEANCLSEIQLARPLEISPQDQQKLNLADQLQQKLKLKSLIRGIDHLATRIFSDAREDAILEYLTLSNYYFWGAYNIEEMNSSTNICRNPSIQDELASPAKVFTANNTPHYVKTIDKLPSPTEDFVRNFGPRMHHIAYEIFDGAQADGTKNIDYVVGKLYEKQIPFLAKIIGECKDFPDLKQIFSKSSDYSFLITEYVQRCHGFQGFFTKTNVAKLTQAAGQDEKLKKSGVCD